MNILELTGVKETGLHQLIKRIYHFNGLLAEVMLTTEQQSELEKAGPGALVEAGWRPGALIMLAGINEQVGKLEWLLSQGKGKVIEPRVLPEEKFRTLIFPLRADILNAYAE